VGCCVPSRLGSPVYFLDRNVLIFLLLADADPSERRSVKRTRGTLLNVFKFLRQKKDSLLPQVAGGARVPSQYRAGGLNDKPY
jgi:hypothetical protein